MKKQSKTKKSFPRNTSSKAGPSRSSSSRSDSSREGSKLPSSHKSFPHTEDRGPSTKRSNLPVVRPLIVWGRHVIESFFSKVSEKQDQMSKFSKTRTPYLLHIIVDKSGQVPGQLAQLNEIAKSLGIKTISHRSEQTWPLADIKERIVHQRVCLQVPSYPTESLEHACEIVKTHVADDTYSCAGIVLDQVQDPRNFGAILRSAAFFGVKFVIYAENRQADISSLVLKASAGGAFSVSLIPVVNINRALAALKTAGAWILGTANTEESVTPQKLPKDRVWISVFGNEGSGMRPEVQKNCDFVAKIPGGSETLDSLNVSVAAGILLHNLQSENECLD